MHNLDAVVTGALDMAYSEALGRQNLELHPAHLLWGLMHHPKAKSKKLFAAHKEFISALIAKVPTTPNKNININDIKPTPDFSKWITLANAESVKNSKDQLEESHLLAFVSQFFPQLKDVVPNSSNAQEGAGENLECPTFLVNLNELAKAGKLDPVIGRSKEIRSVMEVLGRRSKNNPILVGPAGVGKTAIVEGLAEKIVKDEVPDLLKDKIIYSLDMGALMAGTKFRGEFEERLQTLLAFIKGQAGQAILFIDEIHQLVGAGKTDGAMDAANLLKPALARGDLHCIGATTPEEHQKYILKDAALDRRFRGIPVNEPSIEDSIEILMGIREKQESHHGIKISDEAIYQAVILSDQYINHKQLPDKAIDLIDEAASAVNLSAMSMPASLMELEANIRSKLILAKVEKNNPDLLKEVEELKVKLNAEKTVWEKQQNTLKQVAKLKSQLDRYKFDLDLAQRKQDYDTASRIQYGLIPEIQKQIEVLGENWILKPLDIAQIISRQTHVPVEKILQSKQDRILQLEPELNKEVFGQEVALHEIAETLVASHAGLSDPTRPLGSFLCLGPTGVGKTQTVKSLCKFMFNTEKNLIRIDMSEYSEKHSVAKLIGAPAGYVGYDEGGVLTEAVRLHPYSIVLFDEIEKAHPDFADILLQILDDGRLTDNKGRTIDFKNTIIFMTSNSKNPSSDFKPEVLGRIDEILHFNSLNPSLYDQLIQKELKDLNSRLKSQHIQVKLSDKFLKELKDRGFNIEFGARPLKGVFNKMVIRPISRQIMEGKIKADETVIL